MAGKKPGLHEAVAFLRALGFSVWDVVCRPQWSALFLIMLLCAAGSAPAGAAMLLLGCMIAVALLGVALRVLGVESPSPASVVRSFLGSPSFKRQLLALVLLALAVGAFRLSSFAGDVGIWMAGYTGGDANLMTALLVAVVGLLGCLLFLGMTVFIMKHLGQAQPEGSSEEDWARNLRAARRSRKYWVEASFTLLLAVVALVPAALLANWAWNVLASVFLPVFFLSVRHAFESRDVNER